MEIKEGKYGIETIRSEEEHKHITLYSQADLEDKDQFGMLRNHRGSAHINNAMPKIRDGCAGILEMTDDSFYVMYDDRKFISFDASLLPEWVSMLKDVARDGN